MKHELPNLSYDYDALEPFIDEQTMRIHHQKHHQAYVTNLNLALENYPDLQDKSIEGLLKELELVPAEIRERVRNHGGGHANHSLFWTILRKDSIPKGEILKAVEDDFGSLDEFKEQFSRAATSLFGSGWVWLSVDKRKLEILPTPNQNSLLSIDKKPILGIDIWEHAYYLKYQNRRPEYVEAFFRVINWERVNENYLETLR